MIDNFKPFLVKILLLILSLSIIFFSLVMMKITIPYFSFRYDIDFLLTKQSILHSDIWRWSFYAHISTSIFVLLAGATQFNPAILNKFVGLHKTIGKLYVILILAVSAPSGLIMSFYANGGVLPKISFATISILWWVFTLVAYVKIRNGNVKQHQGFMIRSYALTLSAISLRLYVLILPHFFLLHAKEMYTLVSFLSWIPNLLIAELIIRFKKL